MSRKSLILCLAVLAVLVLGTGIAVAFLYSDTGSHSNGKIEQVADADRYLLMSVVPSDAVLAASFSKAAKAPEGVYAGLALSESAMKYRSAVSLHYSGEIIPLYVFEVGRASTEPSEAAGSLVEALQEQGFAAEYVNGSDVTGPASGRALVIASKSEVILKSSLRHIEKNLSIMDAPGFVEAMAASQGDDVLFISNSYAGKLLPAMFVKKYSSYSGFISRVADWTVLDLKSTGNRLSMSGTTVYDDDPSEFIRVLANSVPAYSSVSSVLPSYTRFAVSIPLGRMYSYTEAYRGYLDSRQSLQKSLAQQKTLERKMGVSPVTLMQSVGVREVATASFVVGSSLESVILLKADSDDLNIVFKGTDVTSMKNYVPAVHAWPYASFVSSVFGNIFSLKDENCFTYINGWLVIGSLAAVEEYVEGRALEYTLKEYMADASQDDLLSRGKSSLVSYFSFSEASSALKDIFAKDFVERFSSLFESAEFCPAVMSVSQDKKGLMVKADLMKLTLQKSKAPVFERDTVVVVPKGPFEVKNSGTGKTNKFYQNSHLSICLSEDGKDLWGIPFKMPVCGTAQNVDYYANGKLQIVFGAGGSIYMIDRLGRYVSGFPVDLGKDILIGPDVYDFNGTRKYNIMVLHKDNTIEMYNLKGQKPASWKGIKPDETVKALPERIIVGGSTFWVVDTSIQKLIYPFYGGDPLTAFTGNQMIRPDSEVRILDDLSVEVNCYDGKRRTVKLK